MVRISLRLAIRSSTWILAGRLEGGASVGAIPRTWLQIQQYLAEYARKGINTRDDVLEESCAAKVQSKHVSAFACHRHTVACDREMVWRFSSLCLGLNSRLE